MLFNLTVGVEQKTPLERLLDREALSSLNISKPNAGVWEPLRNYVPMQALKYNPFWKMAKVLFISK